MKKIPQRSCSICRTKKDKKELIRLVKNKDNEIKIDLTGKQEGRGAYICNNMECLEKAIKSRQIEKTFEIKINDEIYEELRKIINK